MKKFTFFTLLILSASVMAGSNLVSNGNFKGMSSWSLKLNSEYEGIAKTIAKGKGFSIKIPYATSSGYARMNQTISPMKDGQEYTISYKYKFTGEGTCRLVINTSGQEPSYFPSSASHLSQVAPNQPAILRRQYLRRVLRNSCACNSKQRRLETSSSSRREYTVSAAASH